MAAHTTISKTWSSLMPDVLAAAKSSSVTLYACLATVSTSAPTGSGRPLLLNADRRSEGDALPAPSRTRLSNAFRARPKFGIQPPNCPRPHGRMPPGTVPNHLQCRRFDASHRIAFHSDPGDDAPVQRVYNRYRRG